MAQGFFSLKLLFNLDNREVIVIAMGGATST
jgi:hypothetical protein